MLGKTFSSTTGALFREDRASLSFRPRSAKTIVKVCDRCCGKSWERLANLSLTFYLIQLASQILWKMTQSDSEEEGLDDLEFDRTTEADEDIDEDILDALEGDLAAAAEEATEGEDVCTSLP